jgi:hypothetical protein
MEGGHMDAGNEFRGSLGAVFQQILQTGVRFTWTMATSVAVGIALMFTRIIFDTTAGAADSDHVIGSLVVTFSIMALSEVGRPLRFANIILGAWLVVAPILVTGYSSVAAAASVIGGVLLILLALPLGPIESRYGDWDQWILIGLKK